MHFKKILNYLGFLAVLVVTLSLIFNEASLSEPRDYSYGEITGTIRRVPFKKTNLKWAIAQWMLKNACSWLIIGFLASLIFGQWGYPISWIALVKTRKNMAGLALLFNGYTLKKSVWRMMKNVLPVVLVVAIFIALYAPDTSIAITPCGTEWREVGPVVAISPLVATALNVPQTPDGDIENPRIEASLELFRKRYKISIQDQILLYRKLCEDQQITSRKLLLQFPQIKIAVDQLNRIRKEWGLNRKPGRPKAIPAIREQEKKTTAQVLVHVPKVGLNLFALWLEETSQYEEVLETIYELIDLYKKEHPEADFRLLKSGKKTIAKKWKALNLLALSEIKKLSELDYRQHDLDRILVDGQSYSYNTLRQFLGELERIDAGVSLKTLLAKCVKGNWVYIDGHMIALWSKLKMHKGYITMLGRIMPGSKLVFSHDQSGQAIGFEYYPPDTHLIKIIEDYCRKIVGLTGVTNFVIDREINSVEVSRMFDDNKWGLISLLDANEYEGVESFNKKFSKELAGGSKLYKATWKHWRNDPRRFVIVKESERTLVYWYTKAIDRQGFSAEEIINIYRRRGDTQENSFKHMIAHGALNTNFGGKKAWGPDRSHQRKIDKLNEKIDKLRKRANKYHQQLWEEMKKVMESFKNRHERLLIKRYRKYNNLLSRYEKIKDEIEKIEKQKLQLGEAGLRADRDFRKQTIMTFRTAWVENALKDFVDLLTRSMDKPVDVEIILKLFFNRRSIVVEGDTAICYWVDGNNLSPGYQKILGEIIRGFNLISLTSRGKSIFAELVNFS